MKRLLVALASAVVLGAAFVPVPASAASDFGPVVTKVSYGSDKLQYVDVGTPDVGARVRRPTVVFLHGGGWVGGGPSLWAKEAQAWTDAGWVSVNASYRLGSSAGGNTYATGQDMLQDAASVLALVQRLPHVDRSRVVLVGDSAGGHLTGWLAGRYRSRVAGMILWSPVAAPGDVVKDAETDWPAAAGVEDLATLDPAECPALCQKQVSLAQRAGAMFGYSTRATTGLTYLAGQPPVPTWVAGSTDEWVPYARNGSRFCALAGPRCSEHVVPGTLHGTKIRDAHPELVRSARAWAAKLVKA